MMDSTDNNIGRLLKERREELGRSLQAAADATRIRKTYLESLEDNRFSDLPGRTYVKGFIRVYAAYLGLKSNPLIALLDDLQDLAAEPVTSVPAAVGKPGLAVKHTADSDWRKFLLVFLLVLALGCLLYYLLAIYSGDAPLEDGEQTAVENGVRQIDPGQLQEQSATPPAGPAEPRPAETAPAPSPAVAAPMTDDTSAPPAAVAGQQVRDSRKWPSIPADGASLRMLALADSSLIIKVDAREPQQYQLHDGLDLTWKIKQVVSVEFAAADVARFWLNGKEIDIAGDRSFALEPAAE